MATSVDLDLATVSIERLDVIADGRIRLAFPVGEVPVSINGAVEIEIPSTASVEIIGLADVPSSWSSTENGSTFTGEGTSSYVITVVSGATLVVTQW